MLQGSPQDFLIARIVGLFDIAKNTRARQQQVFTLSSSFSFHGSELYTSGCGTSGLGEFYLRFNGFAFPASSHMYLVCHVRVVRCLGVNTRNTSNTRKTRTTEAILRGWRLPGPPDLL